MSSVARTHAGTTETTGTGPEPSEGLRMRLGGLLASLRRAHRYVRQLERDNLALAREVRRLKEGLSRRLSLDVDSQAFEGGLGGRTAVESYRNRNVARFMEHMNTVGNWALASGEQYADFFLGTAVLADLESIYAAPPTTEEEFERRAAAEAMLKDPTLRRTLSGTGEEHEIQRREFIHLVLSSGVDTSTHELVRRSAEGLQAERQRGPQDEDD
jgi:hypothetical protein